ncbi:hypothetical protein [Rubrimonas cliftonensis]|uniref:Uncharacterized protein n=1 Tax=Rubrimonas cliftonensis TaxID=89524 RepID=A0A1H4FQG4_9RHOB|nr:hypothetical protein [Rubrimonas cliftonensis]SEA99381.1 hypothetical protein SAMN05444370_12633 [Rubrimonas cliftonensis]
MKKHLGLIGGFAAIAALAGCVVATDGGTAQQQPATPQAESVPAVGSASDLSAFQGARAGQSEMGIQNLGYEPVRMQGLTTWWFNRQTGACARIRTANGRYEEVTMLPAEDC